MILTRPRLLVSFPLAAGERLIEYLAQNEYVSLRAHRWLRGY